jgi:Xaa-Pro aminopeptidase
MRTGDSLASTMIVSSFVAILVASLMSADGPHATNAQTARVGADNEWRFPTHRDVFTPANFRVRRERLAKLIPDGIVVLLGAKGVIDAWEEHRNDPTFRVQPVRQEENLFFLTGLSIPGAAVVLDARTADARVYLPDRIRDGAAEVRRLGLGSPLPLADLEQDLDAQIKDRPVYLIVRSEEIASTRNAFGGEGAYPSILPGGMHGTYPEDQFQALFHKRFPNATIRSVLPAMETLRKINDAEEVRALRESVRVSAKGLLAGIAAVAPDVDEREVAAEIEHVFRRSGAQFTAYGADIQSGPNSVRSFVDLFGSYDTANRTMQAGELVLVDHSAEVNYYTCDIARTVPVSGKFDADQRIAYEAYLAAYEAGLAEIRPGVPYLRAGEVAAQVMMGKLSTLPAWLRKPAEAFIERTGGRRPGHFLGMNLHVHEDYESALQPGQVVAYELHLQMPERNWRITIEEAVLVTEKGHDVLSAEIPRSIAGLEKIVGSKKIR